MWFVKDLTEFATEARNLITGEGGQQQGEGNEESRSSQIHQQRNPPTRENEYSSSDVVREKLTHSNVRESETEKSKVVLVGYDGNGIPLFESVDTEIGARYAAAQQTVDLQIAAEELEEDEDNNSSDEEDEEGEDRRSVKQQLRAIIRQQQEQIEALKAQVSSKESNEQRLQAIVSAQQQKIRTLEAQMMAALSKSEVNENSENGQIKHAKNNKSNEGLPSHQTTSDQSTHQQSGSAKVSSPRPPPPSLNDNSTTATATQGGTNTACNNSTPSHPKGSGSSGYESWEDVALPSSKGSKNIPQSSPQPNTSTTNNSASAGNEIKAKTNEEENKNATEDEDWANFV